jgi:glycosyltransferase involved in cell wall biosynthesis
MGRPVLASNVSSLPEIISDGETGFLLPQGDHEALADKILELAADPALRKRIGEAGGARAREKFDAVRIFDEMEAFFMEVVRKGVNRED